jgi:hypothetical protein
MKNPKDVYLKMSESEKEVANYLKELNIWWNYEHPIFVYDDRDRPRVWTPDFYLPELGMYIEVCGSEKFDYKFREEICKNNKIPIFFVHKYKDKNSWKYYLKRRLIEISEKRQKIIDKM